MLLHGAVSLCFAEQQAQQSQALKMFSALLGQQGSGQGQGNSAAEQSAAAGGTSSVEVSPGFMTGCVMNQGHRCTSACFDSLMACVGP
jgi:hypothetical protein